jgi:phosphoserine phosphatase
MSSTVKWLIQLDVDSTFIQQEAIELLANRAGVLEQVSTVTQASMRGELDFSESLIARLKLLKGLSEDVIREVSQEIKLTDGALELVQALHQRGHAVALVSGGFRQIMQDTVTELAIDYFRANELEIIDGFLTGNVVGAIIDRNAKAVALREFAERAGVDMSNTVAIGDGANDLGMMEIAEISIAFNAKPIVEQSADFSIKEPSLRSVMRIIGLN